MEASVLIFSILAPLTLWMAFFLSAKILLLKRVLSKEATAGVSAGLIIALTFFHFIPESLEEYSSLNFSITIVSTLVIFLLIEMHLIPRLYILNKWFPFQQKNIQPEKNLEDSHYHLFHHHPSHASSFSAIGCILVCTFFDGVSLGSALSIDLQTTLVLSLALLMHILPEGLLVFALAQSSSLSFRKTLLLQGIFCTSLGIGILSTELFILSFSHFNILALASGSLIYVGFIHLLPVALQKGRWFFATLIISSIFSFLFHSQ